jgi:hypothetical protein
MNLSSKKKAQVKIGLPSKQKAQALVNLWTARKQVWEKGGFKNNYLKSLIKIGCCAFCQEIRSTAPPDNPNANCNECIFLPVCHCVYEYIPKKILGEVTLEQAIEFFNSKYQGMLEIYDENYD